MLNADSKIHYNKKKLSSMAISEEEKNCKNSKNKIKRFKKKM